MKFTWAVARGRIMASKPVEIHDVKTTLLTLNQTEFQALKNTYYYRWVTALLRQNGWLNVFLGGLTLWLGLSGFGQSIFKVVQTLFGVLIVGQSLWAIRESTTANIYRFSILFILCSIWNIGLAILDGLQGLGFIVGLLGVSQLWGAYQFRKIHERYSQVTLVKPSLETSRLYDAVWKALHKGIIHTDTEYIELQIERRGWRGFLLPEQLVIAFKQRNIVIFANKSDVVFVPTNPTKSGKWLEIVIKLDIASTVGKITRGFYEKYLGWKGEAITVKDAPTELRRMRNTRRYIRIASLIILGIIALFVFSMIQFMMRYV
jgi:hypothetical protein